MNAWPCECSRWMCEAIHTLAHAMGEREAVSALPPRLTAAGLTTTILPPGGSD